ncbi:HTH domain-containing protein [Streptomyces globisporus]|uniref:helix-turn-helix transcriptional regulator n=1 Tax=Streptomyces globisporus TaxID=1908 RepID=UPI0004C5BA88
MRADRLVAALLFFQTRQPRQRVTAAELAAEPGVSERTARRDLEALASAGIPVYAQAGQGGGWSLAGGARTDLTGLTAPEIRELFPLTGPDARVELLDPPEARTALARIGAELTAPYGEPAPGTPAAPPRAPARGATPPG